MREGVLEQVGTAEHIYRDPQTPFIAQFIGNTSLLAGRVMLQADEPELAIDGLERPLRVGALPAGSADGEPAMLVLRAEALSLLPTGTSVARGVESLSGTVLLRAFQGSTVQYEVEVPGQPRPLRVEMAADQPAFAVGDAVTVSWATSEAPVVRSR
jgi:ABC-type Fe3+/spermidine/putrescine transport system ATPase subunit